MTTKKTTTTTTTTSSLQTQVETLSQELDNERAKTRQFGAVLGQLRYRVTEVLDLDPAVRTQVLTEIDTVFQRAL
mgnify:CR=1 FL=1|tara:strand:+ start:12 stop:236 length:225 start_codon:yes stop_codon:yes gene_type:complete